MKNSARRKNNPKTHIDTLTKSKRRCCICFGLNNDHNEKQGQIAHLDHDHSNDVIDNLAFLCLHHHDQYDSKTSQSKSLQLKEVKIYRDKLYRFLSTNQHSKKNVVEKKEKAGTETKRLSTHALNTFLTDKPHKCSYCGYSFSIMPEIEDDKNYFIKNSTCPKCGNLDEVCKFYPEDTKNSISVSKKYEEKISLNISNPLLWKVTDEKYTATGAKDTFAWTERIIEGDVVINVDIESNHKDGEGVIIVYGDGVKWSKGCLIFNITSDSQHIRAHTPYNGAEFLSDSDKHFEFTNNRFSTTIEITDDKATMFVDGEKIVSTFLSNNINRKGRVGFFKYWERPDVTYSNISIIEKINSPLLQIKPEIKIEVLNLSYQSIKNDNDSEIVIISLNPNRYNLKATISYLKGKKNTFNNILLTIEDHLKLRPTEFKPFAIEEGEMKKIDVIFPVEDKDIQYALQEGFFKLQLTDIYGNQYLSKGRFPLNNDKN